MGKGCPDRVTTTHVAGECAVTIAGVDVVLTNANPLTLVWALYNGNNDVYMVDTSDWYSAFFPILGSNTLLVCVLRSPACVISPRYIEDLPDEIVSLGPSRVRSLDSVTVTVLPP